VIERTPAEWRDKLLEMLRGRRGDHDRLRRYYDGEHTLPTAPDKATERYLRLAELGITNMCGLIVDTVVERLVPKGVRLSVVEAEDLDVWRQVWQANALDGEMPIGFEEALKIGRCPMLIWPDGNGSVTWTIEDPDETIVAYRPGDRRERLAALKAFKGDDGEYATLWLPDTVHAWWKPDGEQQWADDPDEAKSGTNPLGVVPVLELMCRPNVKGRPTPELSKSVLRLQDRINKTMFDAVVGAEDGAFPQRVTIGIEIDTDDEGNPINPLRPGPNRVWALDAVEGQESSAKIDQFQAYDIKNLLELADSSMKQLAAVSKTSVFYVLAGLTNVGADTIRMADDASAKKTRGHQVRFGEVIEEGVGLALRALGREAPPDIELEWTAIEVRSPAELADSAIKLSQAGYPFAAVARYVGATQSEIERIEAERAAVVAREGAAAGAPAGA
jgi:hypothetical protein